MNEAHFISSSGGAFRGPVQWQPLDFIHSTFRDNIKGGAGTSIGAADGGMFAMGKSKELYEIYDNIDGKRPFLKLRWGHILLYPLWVAYWLSAKSVYRKWGWQWPIHRGGLYTMDPYCNFVAEHFSVAEFQYPFVAHVVSANTGKHYQIDSRHVGDKRMRNGVVASGCMAPFMQPPYIQLDTEPHQKGREMGWDGGYYDIFPPVAQDLVDTARAEGKKIVIHAVGCTPRGRIGWKPNVLIQAELDMALRAVSFFEDEIYDTDIKELQLQAGAGGEVWLWIPDEDPGSSFDAGRGIMQKRLKEIGVRTVERGPVVLPGLAA